MVNKRDLFELEKFCKEEYKNADSVIHRWGHVARVAEGARWFVKVKNGSDDNQRLAYAAGLLHDIVRPITEERSHSETSAESAEEILEVFNFHENHISKVSKAIKDHRKPPDNWESILHQSVYLADKILEHMGAYLDFRACVWAGELSHTDYKVLEPIEAVLRYYDEASSKFLDREFPEFTEPIVSYQRQWNRRFHKGLKDGKPWTEEMATKLFYKGKEKADFEETLTNFKTSYPEQKRWKKEMISYIKSDMDSSIFNMIIRKPNSSTKF
ncbi:MAG: HD domain-containing protein [Thermoplasmatota archaeon]